MPDTSNELSRSGTLRERRSNRAPSISRSPIALTACRSSTLLLEKGLEASSFDRCIRILSSRAIDCLGREFAWADDNGSGHAKFAEATTAPELSASVAFRTWPEPIWIALAIWPLPSWS